MLIQRCPAKDFGYLCVAKFSPLCARGEGPSAPGLTVPAKRFETASPDPDSATVPDCTRLP